MIESGTLTATVAVVGVVLFAALPGTIYYECPALILAKLYANTMVTSLNNRAFLQIQKPSVATMSHSSADVGTMSRRTFNTTRPSDAVVTSMGSVRVDVLNETHFDSAVPDYEMDAYARVRVLTL